MEQIVLDKKKEMKKLEKPVRVKHNNLDHLCRYEEKEKQTIWR
jgi:hypothetical protein